MFKALIFDVDGTLADTERDGHRPAFNQAFDVYNLPWVWDVSLYGKLLSVTGGKERIRHFAEHYLPPGEIPPELDTLIPELHQAKNGFYTELLNQGRIPLRPGVDRLLTEAHQAGVRLAIATTTTPENVTALLDCTLGRERSSWFEVIGAGDIVPKKKPAPDIYSWTLEKLGLSPNQCIAFEDSENGLRSALGAGLPTLVTLNDYTRDQDFRGALAVLSDLGDENQSCQRFDAGPCPRLVNVEWLKAI